MAISSIPAQQESHRHPGGITLTESHQGLWRYHQNPDEIFPEFHNTEDLVRFLREHNYVMWNADKT